MFSRVGRLTTFGAQAVSNCPFRRDNIYQQPLKVTAPINDQIVNFAHNFSRPRTTSFGNDPFLGVPMDDEDVIKELELLDLDSWHTKPRAPCPPPSDNLDLDGLDQFWDGKNVTVCGRDPRNPVDSTDCFELEAWRPTDTWQSNPQQIQQSQSQQPHSSSHEMMHDFSNFGENMGSPLFRSPSKSSIDLQSSRLDERVPKFEMELEDVSKTVDWEAWNHYLDCDDDIKRPEAFFTSPEDSVSPPMTNDPDVFHFQPPPPQPQLKPNPIFKISSSNQTFSTSSSGILSTTSSSCSSAPRLHEDLDLFSSGPLICVPKEEVHEAGFWPAKQEIFEEIVDKDDEDYFPAAEVRRTSSRIRKSTSALRRQREESERSWTPASDDFSPSEEKVKFKKRGVVLKPSVDEETDRRRALNRIAAVRYREKKRAEKLGRKHEFQEVVDRNRVLLQKERQLKREINAMKKELRKMGAIIH